MIQMTYDGAADALMIELSPDAMSAKTKQVAPGVRLDFDASGRVIGVEILAASFHVPRADLEHLPTGAELLTLEEAARESGRAASTLRVQLNAGRLKGVKRGRDWYVDATDLLNYVETLSPRGRRPAKPAGGGDASPRRKARASATKASR
jgi:uncharacterized protein YuzE